MFSKSERSSFKYWFAHWCAYNMTALNLGMWKPKYLLHDIEKPWLMLLWKDYNKVQYWHRTHNNHHIEYPGKKDYEAMLIDWECSRFTKLAMTNTVMEELNEQCTKCLDEHTREQFRSIMTELIDKNITENINKGKYKNFR